MKQFFLSLCLMGFAWSVSAQTAGPNPNNSAEVVLTQGSNKQVNSLPSVQERIIQLELLKASVADNPARVAYFEAAIANLKATLKED